MHSLTTKSKLMRRMVRPGTSYECRGLCKLWRLKSVRFEQDRTVLQVDLICHHMEKQLTSMDDCELINEARLGRAVLCLFSRLVKNTPFVISATVADTQLTHASL